MAKLDGTAKTACFILALLLAVISATVSHVQVVGQTKHNTGAIVELESLVGSIHKIELVLTRIGVELGVDVSFEKPQ